MLSDLAARCDAIEECYEFMLAYAAQGLPTDVGAGSGGQLRHLLGKAAAALSDIAKVYAEAIQEKLLTPPEPYEAFLAVFDRDAKDALACLNVVITQPSLSSQLIDNLNASIHLRSLLTDLFLIDEIIKAR